MQVINEWYFCTNLKVLFLIIFINLYYIKFLGNGIVGEPDRFVSTSYWCLAKILVSVLFFMEEKKKREMSSFNSKLENFKIVCSGKSIKRLSLPKQFVKIVLLSVINIISFELL